jgi:hypothetical protein
MKRTFRKPSLVKSAHTLQAGTAQPMSPGRTSAPITTDQ